MWRVVAFYLVEGKHDLTQSRIPVSSGNDVCAFNVTTTKRLKVEDVMRMMCSKKAESKSGAQDFTREDQIINILAKMGILVNGLWTSWCDKHDNGPASMGKQAITLASGLYGAEMGSLTAHVPQLAFPYSRVWNKISLGLIKIISSLSVSF
jgi:hypothetical protein